MGETPGCSATEGKTNARVPRIFVDFFHLQL
jgi:hypothetical protein